MLFQTPAAISSVRTLVDGGCKLDVITRELAPDEMTELFKLKGKEGWMLFRENEIKDEDVKNLPDIKDEFDKKTPSQRLRDRLFVYFNKNYDNKNNFSEWYNNELNTIGLKYLDKLN